MITTLLAVNFGGVMGVLEKVACDVIERPKMPRATWDALRAHVVRERKKKKEENQEVMFGTSSFEANYVCDKRPWKTSYFPMI